MVFGWGKKKSEKQEPEMAPQKKQILLSDVPNVVDEIRSIRTKTIIAEVKTFKNKIKPSCETILHIAIDLERDTLNVDNIDIGGTVALTSGNYTHNLNKSYDSIITLQSGEKFEPTTISNRSQSVTKADNSLFIFS